MPLLRQHKERLLVHQPKLMHTHEPAQRLRVHLFASTLVLPHPASSAAVARNPQADSDPSSKFHLRPNLQERVLDALQGDPRQRSPGLHEALLAMVRPEEAPRRVQQIIREDAVDL